MTHWHPTDCGMSWSGFNVSGDKKSIDEVRRLQHREGFLLQIEATLRERVDYLARYVVQLERNATVAVGIIEELRRKYETDAA